MIYRSGAGNNRDDDDRQIRLLTSFVLYACSLFLLVLFTRSIFSADSFSNPTQQSAGFSVSSLFKASINCADFNDKYEECVKAKNEGRGCAWYSNCQLCVKKDNKTEEDYEKLCREK